MRWRGEQGQIINHIEASNAKNLQSQTKIIFQGFLSKLKGIKVDMTISLESFFFFFPNQVGQTLTEISCAISAFGWNFQNKQHEWLMYILLFNNNNLGSKLII